MSTEKYIGEAAIKDKPQKKLSLVIRKGSVNTDKLADKSVTIPKIADDVWRKIANDIDYSELSPDNIIRWTIDHSCLWQIEVDDSEDREAAILEGIKSIPSQFRVLGCIIRVIGTEDDRVIGTYKYTYPNNYAEEWENFNNWELIPTYAEIKSYVDNASTDIKKKYLPLTGGTLTGNLTGTNINADKFIKNDATNKEALLGDGSTKDISNVVESDNTQESKMIHVVPYNASDDTWILCSKQGKLGYVNQFDIKPSFIDETDINNLFK